MRVLIADYAGHPFQYDLAVELADRGHDVHHSYCSNTVTPQASFDHGHVSTHAISTGGTFSKYHLVKRVRDELRYGWKSVRLIRRVRPQCIITSNYPIVSLALVWAYTAISRTRWILWLQDIQSGLASMLNGVPGAAAGVLGLLERFLLRRADHVIAISQEFHDEMVRTGVRVNRLSLIENWAPLHHLPQRPRRNDWSRRHGVDDCFVYLYSGTLGMKHNPSALLDLADALSDDAGVKVLVISEGMGADWLAAQLREQPRPNLVLLPFQPFDQLPDVLASADVLIVLLEAAAGGFSVPSKTLSYLCAGRPLLAAVPEENACASLIGDRAAAGMVVPPGDMTAFVASAELLRRDGHLRTKLGARARRYAEASFDRHLIGDRFEDIFTEGITP